MNQQQPEIQNNMRVLLDENLDWRVVRYFDPDFQVTTVSRQGWKGMKNGELLEQASATSQMVRGDRSRFRKMV